MGLHRCGKAYLSMTTWSMGLQFSLNRQKMLAAQVAFYNLPADITPQV